MWRRSVILFAVMLLVALATAQRSLGAQDQTVERIAIPTLEQKLASGATFILIDVREDYELEESGAIEGAIHIPMGELEARMPDIPKDIELVFY